MSNYLELTQLPDGTIVLRRSDDHENPIVKHLYDEFLDKPLSEKAHELLHTCYFERGL